MGDQGPGPLAGIRVLDLSSVIMGPFATQILGDLGADVITVESAGGDTSRIMASGPHPELSGIALNILRNKRNVALNLKDPNGREAVLRIAARCDVLVTNLRPKSLERLRLTYADVAAACPDIVYCQSHGFATDSDRADDPAYDDIIQAASGVADVCLRATGQPGLIPTIMADKVCGLTIVYAVLAALLHRARTGEGQFIEVPMVDTMKAFMLVEHGAGAIASCAEGDRTDSTDVSAHRAGTPGYMRILTPNRRPQQTLDGWVHILPYTSAHYEVLFRVGGRADLAGDSRFATMRDCIMNSDFLYQAVQSVTPDRTTAEWLAICAAHSIPATPVMRLDELVAELPVRLHPAVGPYLMIPPPVRFSRTPAADVRLPAPLIGQHTREVLAEVGYPTRDIDALASRQR